MNRQSSESRGHMHRYPTSLRLFTLAFNVLAFTYPPYLSARSLWRALAAGTHITFAFVVELILLAIFGCTVLLLTANFFPEVLASSSGLHVRFAWRTYSVLPAQIAAIKPLRSRLAANPYAWVIATSALTPFHRLYGIIYGHWLHPSFIVYSSIGNREVLLETIEEWLRDTHGHTA